MPWKNDPQNWWQITQLFLATAGAVAIGTIARVAEELQSGERKSLWTRRLLVDGVGLLAMVLVSVGLSEYYDLGRWAHGALAVILGKVGSKGFDMIVDAAVDRIRGVKR